MEYWAGFGISYQLTDHFSIGFSHFGAYRNVKYGSSYGVSILPKDYSGTEVYQYNNRQSIEYFNVKGLIKPSISLTLDNFRFGLAATLPSFNMFGKAKAYREISIINIADVDPSLDVDVQVVDRVEGLDAVHKENGSIAFGVSWRLGKRAWLHFTNETFFGGKRYYIFKADEMPSVYPDVFTQQELEDLLLDGENFLALSEETEARTNIGIGLEAPMGKRLGLYLGARTNFLYKQIEPEYREVMKIESSKWSLVDFSGGLVYLTKKNKRYTAGIEYATAPFNLLNYAVKVPTHSFKLLLEIEVGKPQTQDSKTP